MKIRFSSISQGWLFLSWSIKLLKTMSYTLYRQWMLGRDHKLCNIYLKVWLVAEKSETGAYWSILSLHRMVYRSIFPRLETSLSAKHSLECVWVWVLLGHYHHHVSGWKASVHQVSVENRAKVFRTRSCVLRRLHLRTDVRTRLRFQKWLFPLAVWKQSIKGIFLNGSTNSVVLMNGDEGWAGWKIDDHHSRMWTRCKCRWKLIAMWLLLTGIIKWKWYYLFSGKQCSFHKVVIVTSVYICDAFNSLRRAISNEVMVMKIMRIIIYFIISTM